MFRSFFSFLFTIFRPFASCYSFASPFFYDFSYSATLMWRKATSLEENTTRHGDVYVLIVYIPISYMPRLSRHVCTRERLSHFLQRKTAEPLTANAREKRHVSVYLYFHYAGLKILHRLGLTCALLFSPS